MADAVLIVDDEKYIRDLLETWLNDAGYDTHMAVDGQDGLRQLHEHGPDLIISDVWMPGMDGYLFSRLARRASDAAIIMMTGAAQEVAVLKETDVGVDGFMVKPIEMADFLKQVASAIEKRRQKGKPTAQLKTEPPAPTPEPAESDEAAFAINYRMLSEADRNLIHRIVYRLLSAARAVT